MFSFIGNAYRLVAPIYQKKGIGLDPVTLIAHLS